jgi:hypothetical protein
MNTMFEKVISDVKNQVDDSWIDISTSENIFDIKNINTNMREVCEYNEELDTVCQSIRDTSVAMNCIVYDKNNVIKEYTHKIIVCFHNFNIHITVHLTRRYLDENYLYVDVSPLWAYDSLLPNLKDQIKKIVQELKNYIASHPSRRLLFISGELKFIENRNWEI